MKSSTAWHITPPKRLLSMNWSELWAYRDLLVVLAWRDIIVRYKQTALGIVWALIQPFVTLVVFTFIFGGIAQLEGEGGTPYAVSLCVGLVIWQFASATMTTAGNSLVQNSNMVQKIYFPRLYLPVSALAVGVVDFLIASIVLAGVMIYYRFLPHIVGIVFVIPVLVVVTLFSLGLGLGFAALNVKYRDVRHALPFIVQIVMYLTPVIYPVTILNSHALLQGVLNVLNPMWGLITITRSTLLLGQPVDWLQFLISFVMSAAYFLAGLYYFRSTERYFADLI